MKRERKKNAGRKNHSTDTHTQREGGRCTRGRVGHTQRGDRQEEEDDEDEEDERVTNKQFGCTKFTSLLVRIYTQYLHHFVRPDILVNTPPHRQVIHLLFIGCFT